MKNVRIFIWNFQFLVVKFSVYLNRRVFVMNNKDPGKPMKPYNLIRTFYMYQWSCMRTAKAVIGLTGCAFTPGPCSLSTCAKNTCTFLSWSGQIIMQKQKCYINLVYLLNPLTLKCQLFNALIASMDCLQHRFCRPRWLSWMRVRSPPGRQHSFVDSSIMKYFATAIPSRQLSVSGERMCTLLVNPLED